VFAGSAETPDAALRVLLERLIGLWIAPVSFAFGTFVLWAGSLVF